MAASIQTPTSRLAPWLTTAPTFAGLLLIPWARDLGQLADAFNVGLLLLLAILAPYLLATTLTAFTPNATLPPSALLRQSLRQLSFQLPLTLALLIPILVAGSLNLPAIAQQQSQKFPHWLIFHDPFNTFAFLLVTISLQGLLPLILSPLSGPQMPIPNSQSPSSPHASIIDHWSLIIPPSPLLLLSALQTTLWLGAWYDPFNLVTHLEHLSHDSAGITNTPLALLANLLGFLVLPSKTLLLLAIQKSLTRNLPRFRLAEIFRLVYRFLLPAAAFNLLAAAAYLWLIEPLPRFQATIEIVLAVLVSVAGLVIAMPLLYARFSKNDHRVNPLVPPTAPQ